MQMPTKILQVSYMTRPPLDMRTHTRRKKRKKKEHPHTFSSLLLSLSNAVKVTVRSL
jgi:hypothetical protein